ncbi:hypothetical protein pipiens_006585, partial [Culex pipiens pipiens]
MDEQVKNLEILKRISGVEMSRFLLREYTDLENGDLVLSEEEVLTELDRLSSEYPNILDYVDSDLAEREEQLEQLVAVEEQYEKLIAEAKRTESALIKELSELDMKLIDGQFHQGRVAAECGEKASFLQDIQGHTQQQIFDMHQCYVQKALQERLARSETILDRLPP